jgi:aquaporin Z
VGIGLLGVSFAFGLTVLTMAYAIGHISGCHLNPPCRSVCWAGGGFPASELFPYIVAQLLGARPARGAVRDCERESRFSVTGGFASNGYGDALAGCYSFAAAFTCEW